MASVRKAAPEPPSANTGVLASTGSFCRALEARRPAAAEPNTHEAAAATITEKTKRPAVRSWTHHADTGGGLIAKKHVTFSGAAGVSMQNVTAHSVTFTRSDLDLASQVGVSSFHK
jgi:hypothetical protein